GRDWEGAVERVRRADRPHPDGRAPPRHRSRPVCPRPPSGIRRRLPPRPGPAAVPGVVLGAGPRRALVPAPGRAHGPGGPDPPGGVARLRGLRPAGPVQAGPPRLVATCVTDDRWERRRHGLTVARMGTEVERPRPDRGLTFEENPVPLHRPTVTDVPMAFNPPRRVCA